MISTLEQTDITPDDAAHALWHFGLLGTGGKQPGQFTKHLILAIASADFQNRAILREAYPSLAAAVLTAQYNDDGINELRVIAAGGR